MSDDSTGKEKPKASKPATQPEAGNILAGVQPKDGEDENGEERRQ